MADETEENSINDTYILWSFSTFKFMCVTVKSSSSCIPLISELSSNFFNYKHP